MGKVNISTKASTLLAIKNIVKKSYIEDILIIQVGDYINAKNHILHKIESEFSGDHIVVRSSSKNEDALVASNAGHYESVLGIDPGDEFCVDYAIKKVIDSYKIDGQCEEQLLEEQILIQRQTKKVKLAGVIFTRDIVNNLPYYMLTYDDSGSTDSVTSGQAGKTVFIAKNASREFLTYDFAALIEAVKEIENIFCEVEALDIEFGIREDGKIVIFQVRPLAAVLGRPRTISDKEFLDSRSIAKCEYLDRYHILSDMAFWNPAEIIGTDPRPLDYSLYKELITSGIWSKGISKLGYQLVEDDLMEKVGNKPYISVNYTFDGLTPANLPQQLRYRLNQYYEKKLRADKTAHDKMEFEIIFNTFDFTTRERLQELEQENFSTDEIKILGNSLFRITNNAVKKYTTIVENDKAALENMRKLRHEIRANSPLSENNVMKLYKYIEQLLNSIKENGTPQFTRHARCAFMARSFCRTLVEKGYFEPYEMDAFMLSITTVASEFERDFDKYSHGQMTRKEFDSLYGHLRLGTYDIRTDCYRQTYFDIEDSQIRGQVKVIRPEYKLDEERLQKALDDVGFDFTPQEFVNFIIEATKNRELFKFEFTKSLSFILDIIIRLGEMHGIAREDMSYLEIHELMSYHSRESYLQIIEARRNMYHAYSYLILPEVIFDVGDIDVIEIDEARPNFITNKCVEAYTVNLDMHTGQDITGKIVIVTKADPGYDWIFTKNIAGFVTKYGGAASHMAIRCAEFGIPAAIGCGEKIFRRISNCERLMLDCQMGEVIEK